MRQDEARVQQAIVQLRAAAEAAAMRGSLLFHLDLAASLATDALAAAGVPADFHAMLVDADGYGVLALEDGAFPRERAMVRFAADGRPVLSERSGAATLAMAALARARRTAAGAGLVPGRSVAIAIPQRSAARPSDPIEAYVLALPPADAASDLVLGIHWRLSLSGDGDTILTREPLSRTALVLPGARGVPAYGIEVTHFGAVPSETHTWLSLKHGVAIRVVAMESMQLWDVEGERTTHAGEVPADR